MLKPNLQKSCRVCGVRYTAWSVAANLNRFCSLDCAMKFSQLKRAEQLAKHRRREIRQKRAALKTRSDWQKEAQASFNRFIRERDYGQPCISCGSLPEQRRGGTMDCGHYRSTGAAPHLRFNTGNAAAQCVRCNRDLSGNTVEMRKGMVERWGAEHVERIEADDTARKYSAEDLKRIKRIFSKRANLYRRLRGE